MNTAALMSLVASLVVLLALSVSVSALADPAQLTLKDFFMVQEGDSQILYVNPSYLNVEPTAIYVTAGFQLFNEQNVFVNLNSNNPSNRYYTPLTYDAKWNAYRVIGMANSELAKWPRKEAYIIIEYDGASRSWEIPLENVPARASSASNIPQEPAPIEATVPAQKSAPMMLLDERQSFRGDEWKLIEARKLPSSQKLTLSGWFFTRALMQNGNEITGSWVSNRNSYILSPNTDGSVSFYVFVNGHWHEAHSASGSIQLNTWEHWAATYDDLTIRLYKNGALVAAYTINAATEKVGSSGDLCIGADCGIPNRYFIGEAAKVTLTTAELSAQEIRSLYDSQRSAFYQGQGMIVTKPTPGKENAPAPAPVPPTSATPIPFPVAKILGNDNAPVTIEVFASVSEPFFQRWYTETYPSIKQNYIDTGKARLVFKHFTLSFRDDTLPTRAAECAARQNKFFEYLDTSVKRNSPDVQKESLVKYARNVGMDENTFSGCLSNELMDKAVQRDKAEAEFRGVQGSPTFFINGKKIEVAQSLTVFEEAITGRAPPRGDVQPEREVPKGTNPAKKPALPGTVASEPVRAPQGTNPTALPQLPVAVRKAPQGITPVQQPDLPSAHANTAQQRQAPQGITPEVHPLLPGSSLSPQRWASINREAWGKIQLR